MAILKIQGGTPLRGEAVIRGSKNAATKMMVASLLTEEPCTIENVPFSADVEITRELCEKVGSSILFQEPRVCRLETKEVRTSFVPELSRKNRIPILAIGPLLHRKGFAEVPVLGGCPIGHRPINFHLEALRKMGARIERRENSYYAEASELHGEIVEFPYPSVGATENVILAATLARGKTTIQNAAIEPEIVNLIEMLRGMGAKIECSSESRRVEVEGVPRLSGTRIRVMPDRNEVVSFAAAALATGGDVYLQDVSVDYLQSFLGAVTAIGGNFEVHGEDLRFWGEGPYAPLLLETSPHPGFMTDWQQPFCVLLTQAGGESIIHETVYEDRFGYVKDLNRMGAHISVSDECLGGPPCRFSGRTFHHSARVKGPTPLHATEIAIPDIRAGIAHIVAALAAEGESVISGVEHIDRGYEKIDERLKELGADIERV